jgi:hypothetical protein
MSDGISAAQLDWVARVLGVKPQGGETGAPAVSLVKLGKARIEFIEVRRRATSAIGLLRQTLQTRFGDDTGQAPQLAKADKMLADLVVDLNDGLNEKLDDVLTAEPAKRPALAATARASLQRTTKFVTSDPLMSDLDGNEVVPQMQVTAPLIARLQAIADALG